MRILFAVMVLIAGTVLFATPTLAQPAQQTSSHGDLVRQTGSACVFGGAVLGVTSLLVLYPALAGAPTTVPVGSVILGNTLFGCGIAAVGAAAAYGFSWFYDSVLVGSTAPVAQPTRSTVTLTTPHG